MRTASQIPVTALVFTCPLVSTLPTALYSCDHHLHCTVTERRRQLPPVVVLVRTPAGTQGHVNERARVGLVGRSSSLLLMLNSTFHSNTFVSLWGLIGPC